MAVKTELAQNLADGRDAAITASHDASVHAQQHTTQVLAETSHVRLTAERQGTAAEEMEAGDLDRQPIKESTHLSSF